MVLTRGAALRQPILAPDVELRLIRAYKETKDEKALDAISRSYARLCYSIASHFTNDENRIEDLAQEGSFGIRKAVEKYDPEKGTKFSTYSRLWIQNYVAMAAASVLNDITVPARAFIDARMGRIQPGRNDSAVFAAMPFIMLDAPVGDENVTSQMDLHVMDEVTPETILAEEDQQNAMRRVIAAALATLTEREATVIMRRKLQDTPDTLEEISEDFGVTRERIRQIEALAMDKLKAALVANGVCADLFFDR
ncbi:sigma-70 family RNA polymerase sigma factor [Rhizobium sp. BK176]|uniref:sigma-70 family RNA polymerase sigma factor n=1 Tax=Rhizobium sp. BK176 TaxID=2587071 RepID=UPI0021673638|nr:sigma-70 family RNA polymerase sigma factor [Rhizobium sp. BK176]MCS4089561.1 RNA polymerase sigma-32 factor [Rhizobium sp. BK176]